MPEQCLTRSNFKALQCCRPATLRAAGARAVHYTDGLVETRSDRLEVGLDALVQRCTELAGQRLDDFTDGILGELPAHSDDDIAILAVRIPDGDAE